MANIIEIVPPIGAEVVEVEVRGMQGPKGDPGDNIPATSTSSLGASLILQASDIPSLKNIVLSANLIIGSLPTGSSTVAGTISFNISQPTTGGPFTVTWPAGIKWSGGAPAPLMPTSPDSLLLVHLLWTGSSWLGVVAGLFQ